MKFLKSLSILALLALMVTAISCGDDDDPKKDGEEDLESPEVTISSPADGSTVSSLDATTSVTIQFQATDDVELASVTVDFDGTQIAEITTFPDFRNYNGEETQDNVGDGEHTITVTATDLSGKTGSVTSTFTKVTTTPYTPLENEVFYMAFEGNYLDAVNEVEATIVGSPDFAGEGKVGDNAYQGAANAYLTFDTENIESTEMTVSFWMKINATPDRAGILVMSPVDTENTGFQNNRTKGFRFFREAAGDNQIFKLNFGTGESDVWLDGGSLAQLAPDTEWHHFAFAISATTAAVYIDGAKVAENTDHIGMDITGCDLLSIMSGVPRFTEWNHQSDLSYMDDLKIFSVALTEAQLADLTGLEFGEPEIQDPGDPGLDPIDGADATEILYMPFDTDFTIDVSSAVATEVGTPSVVDGGVSGKAYSGDAQSYLTIPSDGLLNDSFSASFWIKMDSEATRAGILTVSPPDTENPEAPNNRTSGFRLFREGDGVTQTFKLNVGNGEADTWIDGGAFSTFSATREDWLHVAITVGGGKSQIYLNGILAKTSDEAVVVDWTNCDVISFGSGAPNFTGWGHIGETSLLDELRIYNGVLNPAQIAALKAVGN